MSFLELCMARQKWAYVTGILNMGLTASFYKHNENMAATVYKTWTNRSDAEIKIRKETVGGTVQMACSPIKCKWAIEDQ